MDFVLPNMANCMLEYVFLLTIFVTLKSEASAKLQYVLFGILAFGCACVFTLIDSFLFSILPFNFCLILLSFRLAFYTLKTGEVIWNLLIGYLLLIYLQIILVNVYPTSLMGTRRQFSCERNVTAVCGRFCGNGETTSI